MPATNDLCIDCLVQQWVKRGRERVYMGAQTRNIRRISRKTRQCGPEQRLHTRQTQGLCAKARLGVDPSLTNAIYCGCKILMQALKRATDLIGNGRDAGNPGLRRLIALNRLCCNHQERCRLSGQ